MTFFILALPRTRTAWMSAWLTAMGMPCYHEGMNGCRTVSQYRDKIAGKGDSSTTGLLFPLDDLFPGHKRIIIEGSLQKAVKWGYKVYGTDARSFLEQYEIKLQESPGLHIPVEELDESLPVIWKYLTDKPYNEEISNGFKRLNIQIKDPFNFDVQAIASILQDLEKCQSEQLSAVQ